MPFRPLDYRGCYVEVPSPWGIPLTTKAKITFITHFLIFADFCISEGKPLVHSLQVQYVHQVVQTRLVDNPAPLSEVYYILHFFCQCLQLEVLYSQTLRLIRDRLDDLIHVSISLISVWCEEILTEGEPRQTPRYQWQIRMKFLWTSSLTSTIRIIP